MKFDWNQQHWPGGDQQRRSGGFKHWAKDNPGKVFLLFIGAVVLLVIIGLL